MNRVAHTEDVAAIATKDHVPGHGERVEEGFYIYGLVDPRALHETGGDPLLSIFYVGKGRRSRWSAHEEEVIDALKREQIMLERRSSKAERIRMILDRGQRVPAIRLSAGYVDEKDAYYAESLAIDTVGAALAAAGRPPLTNATPGHHAGFLWLREHFIFTETAEQEVGDAENAEIRDGSKAEILVKGTANELIAPDQGLAPAEILPHAVRAAGDRVLAIELRDGDDSAATIRRGWNALDPWTDLEARERARRYWPIAPHKVASWLQDPTTMPARLLLGIPEPGGRTVVRYAWGVDPSGIWEYYPQMNRWGVPLGDRVREHPRLGATLYETRKGRRVQVLYGYASGFRVLNA